MGDVVELTSLDHPGRGRPEKLVQVTRALIILIIGLGGAATLFAYYPGLMALDSVDQLAQAQAQHYTDWHPPIMAWLWSWTNQLVPGPGGMFLLIVALYWGGFLLIALHLSSKRTGPAISAALLPFAPFLVGIVGTLWKDVLVFGCFLVATALAIPCVGRGRAGAGRMAAGCLFLLVGCMARYNSATGAVPLLMLYLWPHAPSTRVLRSVITRLVVATALMLAVLVGALTSADRLLFKAEKQGIVGSLLLWDLVAISKQTGQNLVPGTWSVSEATDIVRRCYDPSSGNSLLYSSCKFVSDRLHEENIWSYGLFHPWVNAVLHHPMQYGIARIHYLRTLAWPQTVFVFTPEADSYKHGFQANFAFAAISRATGWIKSTFPFYLLLTVGFWMVVATISLGVSVASFIFAPRRGYAALAIAASGVFYVWPLSIVGVAGDFRYCYWSIFCAFFSTLLIWALAPPRPAS